MSLDSTANLKQQLINHLGPKAPSYFEALQSFVTGKISRGEFEDAAKQVLTTATLVQVHNALIISLFDATAAYKRNAAQAAAATQAHEATATPPPVAPSKPPPRKRRRTLLPYQGPGLSDESRTFRSPRMKKWILAMGKKERERIKMLPNLSSKPSLTNGGVNGMPPPVVVEGQPPAPITAHQPQSNPVGYSRPPLDEISSERGVMTLPERGGPPGGRPPIQLHSSTRAPTLQHIADRINLISAQHNLSIPSKANVAQLLSLACEAKLKQLITHALTLTVSSLAISSVNPSSSNPRPANPFSLVSSLSSASVKDREAVAAALASGQPSQSSTSLASSSTLHHIPQKTPVLTTGAFQTLFTLYPSSLPNKSAAAMKLATIPTSVDDDTDDIPVLKDREVRDQRWQMMALLAERSAVRECLKSVR